MKKSLKVPKEIGDYSIDQDSVIGKGSYGKIHLASRKGVGAKMVCKVISKKPLLNLSIYNESMMRETQQQFEREITFHLRLDDNKHIVKLYDFEQDKDAYYLFMEQCDSDLAKLIQQRGKLSQAQTLDYIRQLCLGYFEIYASNASHRDLKPENLLLQNGVLKIADFGFVKELNLLTESITRSRARKNDKDKLRTSTLCGTPEYIPPNAIEAQNNSRIDYDPEKFDMWSIGIIFYYLLCGYRPFLGQNHTQLFNSIQHKALEFPKTVPISEQTKGIIRKLLNKNQEERLQFRLLMKELGLPNPSKEKRSKGLYGRQKLNKGFPPIEQQADEQRIKELVNSRIKYISYLNNLVSLVYRVSSQSAVFKKLFSNNPKLKHFAYKLILRLHELRLLKISTLHTENYREKVTSQIGTQHQNRVGDLLEVIEDFQKVFYNSIKTSCGLSQQPYQELEYLLQCLNQRVKAMDQYQCYDGEVIQVLMLILSLEAQLQKKLSVERLLAQQEIRDQTRMCEEIDKLLK